jgi:hypothetical protein
MYGLPDDDLWKIETCWRCNVLIVKLLFDIVHLVGCNKLVYQIVYGMNNNIKFKKAKLLVGWTSNVQRSCFVNICNEILFLIKVIYFSIAPPILHVQKCRNVHGVRLSWTSI